MPKQSINDSAMKKAPMKMLNLPFEATFRLQVGDIKKTGTPLQIVPLFGY